MNVKEIIDKIKTSNNCIIYQPKGLSQIDDKHIYRLN